MQFRHHLTLFGGFAAAICALPGGSLYSMGEFDSSRIHVAADRQQGRSLFRHSLSMVKVTEDWSLRALDTSLFRYAGSPGAMGGEALLQMGWLQRQDSGWSASWRLWNRVDGLAAPHASVSENAWRQMGLVRGSLGDSSWASSLALGALVEHVDPGAISQGIRLDEPPPSGARGGGVWAWEGAWAGFSETPLSIAAHWNDVLGSTELRQASLGLEGAIQASLTGNNRDTLRLEASADSTRVRSGYFLSDRADAQHGATVSWFLPAGRQKWVGSGGIWRSVARDFSGRNPDQTKNGTKVSLDFEGPLGLGWRHRHNIERLDEDRVWKTATTVDLLENEINAMQDRRDQDLTTDLTLSDTLAWRTESWGGAAVSLGLMQSLRSIRHPLNATPLPTDRPDEDIGRKQFSILLKSDRLAWGDKPALGWTTVVQEDVYLRAIHSFQTWSRDENRLVANLSIPLADLARPNLALWAREQRDTWRFQPAKRNGRLEIGATFGGEVGPQEKPWASLQWTRWRVKSGGLLGEAFAPDQIQNVWNPEFRGFYRWAESWTLEPWSNLYLERVETWQSNRWNMGLRSRVLRGGVDLSGEGAQGGFVLSCARIWSDPGEDEWIGSLSARYAW